MDIAKLAAQSSNTDNPLEIHMTIYVTCLCNPDAVPPIPNCDFIVERPSVHRLLIDSTTPESGLEKVDDVPSLKSFVGGDGGLAVCASGPESLIRETSNAVARMQLLGQASRLGGIGLHTEVFAM